MNIPSSENNSGSVKRLADDEIKWPSLEDMKELRSQEYLGNPHEYFREQYLCDPQLWGKEEKKD